MRGDQALTSVEKNKGSVSVPFHVGKEERAERWLWRRRTSSKLGTVSAVN
jgi:hypothetical protein